MRSRPTRSRSMPLAIAIFALASVPWIAPADAFVWGLPAWAVASLVVTAAWSMWLAVAMRRHWHERSGAGDG